MKLEIYFWIALSLFFGGLGFYILAGTIAHPGPYADGWVLLGGTLSALALGFLFFAFKHDTRTKAPAEHMKKNSRSSARRSSKTVAMRP